MLGIRLQYGAYVYFVLCATTYLPYGAFGKKINDAAARINSVTRHLVPYTFRRGSHTYIFPAMQSLSFNFAFQQRYTRLVVRAGQHLGGNNQRARFCDRWQQQPLLAASSFYSLLANILAYRNAVLAQACALF